MKPEVQYLSILALFMVEEDKRIMHRSSIVHAKQKKRRHGCLVRNVRVTRQLDLVFTLKLSVPVSTVRSTFACHPMTMHKTIIIHFLSFFCSYILH